MAGPLQGERILLLLCIFIGVIADPLPPPPPATSSPWMDTSLCPLTDSLMVCQLKKGMCSPISTIFSPPGGPVKAITSCANNTGTILGPQFFMSVGLTFLAGAPESLSDKASSDPATAAAIRRCALNATGLLNPDLLTLNRTAVSNSLSDAFITPELGAAVAAAVASCPEPVDYKLAAFINCLKVACMNNVAVTPFMAEATSTLTGAGAPTAAAAALVASKKPPPKAPAAGAAAFGAGGAFPYAGAGGATGSSAAGASSPASYMAGAFPYAGAGAFPYAGASGTGAGAAGTGAFPYAGTGGAAGAGAFPGSGGAGSFPGAGGAGAFPYAGAGGGASSSGSAAAGTAAFSGTSGGAPGSGAFPYTGAGGASAFTYPSSSGSSAATGAAPKTT